jgi:hypothetical protein
MKKYLFAMELPGNRFFAPPLSLNLELPGNLSRETCRLSHAS